MSRQTLTTSPQDNDPIRTMAEKLHLFHTARDYAAILAKTAPENLSNRDLVIRLLDNELACRHERLVVRLVKEARLPVIKTIDTFDWAHPTSIPKNLILNALQLDFVAKKGHVIFLGRGGLGKTHLALAIAYAACQMEIRTLYTTAADMINRLVASQADQSLERALRKYCSPRLLVIDELGYLPPGQARQRPLLPSDLKEIRNRLGRFDDQQSLQGLGRGLPGQRGSDGNS